MVDDSTRYNIGENVVNRNTFKNGVVESISTEDPNKVLVSYLDGFQEWVDCSSLSKLLLEVDPKPDGWGRDTMFMRLDEQDG
tara:strand:+ start:253 stop:498 length:246 start_codon:yes stop_codon:yes gene_type:complete